MYIGRVTLYVRAKELSNSSVKCVRRFLLLLKTKEVHPPAPHKESGAISVQMGTAKSILEAE